MEDLKKIDEIRNRTGVSYRSAKDALEKCDGDLVEALIYLEELQDEPEWAERIQVEGHELVRRVKQLIHEGNVRRVIVRQGDKTLLEIPVTVGALGALFLPTLAALGTIAAMVTECTIVVERRAEPGCDFKPEDEDPESEPV